MIWKKFKLKTAAAAACAALLTGMLCACGNGAAGQTAAEGTAETTKTAKTEAQTSEAETAGGAGASSGDTLKIVAGMFPEYDWVREILGDNPGGASLTLLMDSGADLHSYQPTAEDMMRISSCDVFIYTGGVSSQWARDALKGAVNPDMIVIDLLDALGDRAKEETLVEGMQDAHGHEHEGHAGFLSGTLLSSAARSEPRWKRRILPIKRYTRQIQLLIRRNLANWTGSTRM